MTTSANTQTSIECLKHAIEDSQETIRGYDTKAEILAVLLTLAIGITNYTLFPKLSDNVGKYFLFASWLVSFLSIGFLGLVLHPKINQFKAIKFGTYTPNGTYFMYKITDSPQNSVSALADRVLQTNWVQELTYESMKLSIIREKKHGWFILALKLSGFNLLLIAISLAIGAYFAV